LSTLLFAALLRLLPPHRRTRYGDEMRAVRAALSADARRAGRRAAAVLLMQEIGGVMRFALRERLRRLTDWHPAGGGWHPLRELQWAWRGVRARGWRVAFVVALLGVVLAANTVVFSAADAFVFRAVPYPNGARLAQIEALRRGGTTSNYLPVQVIEEWRKHRDLFAGVQAYELSGSAYITFDGVTETVAAESVTPGLFELLGIVPRWGRPFVDADVAPGAPEVVVIGETVARRLYGLPALAIGKRLPDGRNAPEIVGVMPASFRFPGATDAVWRPLSLEPERIPGLLSTNRANVVRLADGVRATDASDAVAARGPAVGQVMPAVQLDGGRTVTRQLEPLTLRTLKDARRHAGAALIFAMLVGAAACLLLIACSNVASLEMAGAARRARSQAVLAALGASRASQVRVAILEVGLMLVCGVGLAVPLAVWGASVLSANLTTSMRDALINPIDVDLRAIGAMVAAGAIALATASLPTLRRLSRLSIYDALRDDTRVLPVTRTTARTRQALMTAQVALTVLLLVGGALYLRSYLIRLAIDRGFDDRNILTVEVLPASDAPRRGAALEAAVLERLRTAPGVRSVSRTDTFPPSTQAGIRGKVFVDSVEQATRPHLAAYMVDPEFFTTMSMPLVSGRAFTTADPIEHVVITERMAQRFWPGASAVGGRFNIQGASFGPGRNQFVVVGVARDFRQDRLFNDTGDEVFAFYAATSPGSSSLRFVARVDDEALLPSIAGAVRSIAERAVVRVDTIDARYARLDGDKRLAASITSGFGVLALVVATAGIYGVMAFLVAGRSREIGIRMALGADRAVVQRLVFRSSLLAVGIGAAIGVVAALIASRWIASELYGVTATDPATYAAVCGLIVATALLATWLPARRAAAVDPAVTLRAL
jgi:predicted permease